MILKSVQLRVRIFSRGDLRLTVTPTSGLLFLSAICQISKASEGVSGKRRKSRMMV